MRNLPARSFVAAVLLLLCASAAQAGANKLVSVTQIPFSDWLAAQSTNSHLVGFIGRTSSTPFAPLTEFGVVDYAGVRAAANHLSFGFSATGSVTLSEYADGSGEVQVNEDFTNAINWTFSSSSAQTIIYGYSPAELAATPADAPALASGHLSCSYTVPDASNADLNLVNVSFNGAGTVIQQKFHSTSIGPLRAAFGVPEGTPGQCNIEENGLFNTSGGGATADQYPAEKVEVKAIGGGVSAVQSAGGTSVQKMGASGAAAAPAHGSWGAIKALYH